MNYLLMKMMLGFFCFAIIIVHNTCLRARYTLLPILGRDFYINYFDSAFSKEDIEQFVSDCNNLNKSIYDSESSDCESSHGLIYHLTIEPNSAPKLLPMHISINSNTILISKSTKADSIIELQIDLGDIVRIDQIKSFNYEGCFNVISQSKALHNVMIETNLCDINLEFITPEASKPKHTPHPFSKLYWISKISKMKECLYKKPIVFPQIQANQTVSVSEEDENLEIFLEDIRNILKEAEIEENDLKQIYIEKLHKLIGFKKTMKSTETALKEKIKELNEENLNKIDEEAAEQLNNVLNLKFLNLEKMKKDILHLVLNNKIQQAEKLKQEINQIGKINSDYDLKKKKLLMKSVSKQNRLKMNNQCTDNKYSIKEICNQIFGLSGEEECADSTVSFCNSCCSYYIGSKWVKEKEECKTKCHKSH